MYNQHIFANNFKSIYEDDEYKDLMTCIELVVNHAHKLELHQLADAIASFAQAHHQFIGTNEGFSHSEHHMAADALLAINIIKTFNLIRSSAERAHVAQMLADESFLKDELQRVDASTA